MNETKQNVVAKLIRESRVATGKVRLSYAHLFEPAGDNEKYSVSIIIDKDDEATQEAIDEAVQHALEKGKQKFGSSFKGSKLHMPLHDGDEEKPDDENYAGKLYLNCSNKKAPQVVDINCDRIEDPDEVYSGCYARVSIEFFPYSVNGNMGVAASLQNVQKLEDGERLGGGHASAISDFGGADDFLS